MSNIKNDVKDLAKELEMLSSEVEAGAEKKAATVKKAASKAKETAKKTAEETKTAAKQTAEKAKTTAKKVASSARRKEVKKTAVVEFYGNQFEVEDIIAKAEKAYKSENKSKSISSIKVYIKPEDNAAYYVVDNKSAGKVDLID